MKQYPGETADCLTKPIDEPATQKLIGPNDTLLLLNRLIFLADCQNWQTCLAYIDALESASDKENLQQAVILYDHLFSILPAGHPNTPHYIDRQFQLLIKDCRWEEALDRNPIWQKACPDYIQTTIRKIVLNYIIHHPEIKSYTEGEAAFKTFAIPYIKDNYINRLLHKDYATALDEAAIVLTFDPRSLSSRYTRSIIFLITGQLEQGINELADIKKIYAAPPLLFLNIAIYELLKVGQLYETIACYSCASCLYPRDQDILRRKAILIKNFGRPDIVSGIFFSSFIMQDSSIPLEGLPHTYASRIPSPGSLQSEALLTLRPQKASLLLAQTYVKDTRVRSTAGNIYQLLCKHPSAGIRALMKFAALMPDVSILVNPDYPPKKHGPTLGLFIRGFNIVSFIERNDIAIHEFCHHADIRLGFSTVYQSDLVLCNQADKRYFNQLPSPSQTQQAIFSLVITTPDNQNLYSPLSQAKENIARIAQAIVGFGSHAVRTTLPNLYHIFETSFTAVVQQHIAKHSASLLNQAITYMAQNALHFPGKRIVYVEPPLTESHLLHTLQAKLLTEATPHKRLSDILIRNMLTKNLFPLHDLSRHVQSQLFAQKVLQATDNGVIFLTHSKLSYTTPLLQPDINIPWLQRIHEQRLCPGPSIVRK